MSASMPNALPYQSGAVVGSKFYIAGGAPVILFCLLMILVLFTDALMLGRKQPELFWINFIVNL